MITKDELAAMIAALESQPHLSLKEEKYLAVCKELESRRSVISDIRALPGATDNDSKYACDEYLDALVTIELAVAVARGDGRPVNAAIRACWANIRQRITNRLNRDIFDGLVKQFMPHGALCMLRRRLDDC